MEVLRKRGHYVSVLSWENDADAYNTEAKHLFGLEEAKLLVEFVKLFRSKHDGGIGNLIEWFEDEIEEANEKLVEFFQHHPTFGDEFKVTPSIDGISPLLHDLGLTSENFVTRVAEKVEIQYVPEDHRYDLIESISID